MMVVNVARWPGFSFNAQSFVAGLCAVYKDRG
jgi:hypothetical protein